jgi:hypothetical protein
MDAYMTDKVHQVRFDQLEYGDTFVWVNEPKHSPFSNRSGIQIKVMNEYAALPPPSGIGKLKRLDKDDTGWYLSLGSGELTQTDITADHVYKVVPVGGSIKFERG